MLKTLKEKLAKQDFHVHTFFSPCAREPGWTPREIARKADEGGMETVLIADHFYQRRPGFSPPPFYAGVDERCYRETVEEIKNISSRADILPGCEVDMIRPGLYTVSESFAWKLPAVLVSASHYHLEGIDKPASDLAGEKAKFVIERMRSAVSWPPARILAHPLTSYGALGDFREVLDAVKDEEFREVFSLARENKVAIEIRASVFAEGSDLSEHHYRFYSLAREERCKIAPATDAHKADSFGKTGDIFPYAEKLGFVAEDVIDSLWLKTP